MFPKKNKKKVCSTQTIFIKTTATHALKISLSQGRFQFPYTNSYTTLAPTYFVYPLTLCVPGGLNKSRAAGRSPRYVTSPLCSVPSIHALQSMPVEVAPLCMLFQRFKWVCDCNEMVNKDACESGGVLKSLKKWSRNVLSCVWYLVSTKLSGSKDQHSFCNNFYVV